MLFKLKFVKTAGNWKYLHRYPIQLYEGFQPGWHAHYFNSPISGIDSNIVALITLSKYASS